MSAFGNSPLTLGGNALSVPSGSTPVGGPGTSTDNAIARWDGTGGNLIQNSVLIVADTTGALSGFTTGAGLTFHEGGTLTGASGALTLTASGTNQSITLAPSGTGFVRATKLAAVAGNALQVGTTDGTHTIFLQSGAEVARIAPNSNNWLFGTTTNSANGILQLANHAAATGGVGFGTAASIWTPSSGGTTLQATAIFRAGYIETFSGGTTYSQLGEPTGNDIYITAAKGGGTGSGIIFRTTTTGNAQTTALTLDSSQNATFVGFLSKGGANGQLVSIKQLSELTTIAAAASTATAIQIPANAIVVGVSVRVTTVIPDAATFTVTGTTSATAFQTGASVSTAATTTDAGTKSCPYLNTTAQTITFTFNTPPLTNTGRIRVTIHYIEITPATS